MKDNFRDRVNQKIKASGITGRSDLELHDAKVLEPGAVKVLATYSPIYGPPSVLDVQSWVKEKMGPFGERVTARMDTVQAMPEMNAISFVVDHRRARMPLEAAKSMVKSSPDTFLDDAGDVWEVVKGESGPDYILRRDFTSVEEMLKVRQAAFNGNAPSARKKVIFASEVSGSAPGGYANLSLADTVEFYHAGRIHKGVVESVGLHGVKIASDGDVYTVDPAAVTSILEKSAGARKEQDDVLRRYFSHVYPGNPEMTEIISPLASRPIEDNRGDPGGLPLQPIEVVASAKVSARARLAKKDPAPFGKTSK